MSGGHYADAAIEPALGSTMADNVLKPIADGSKSPEAAYVAVSELAGLYGWKSPAVRHFIVTLAKRAAAASVR